VPPIEYLFRKWDSYALNRMSVKTRDCDVMLGRGTRAAGKLTLENGWPEGPTFSFFRHLARLF